MKKYLLTKIERARREGFVFIFFQFKKLLFDKIFIGIPVYILAFIFLIIIRLISPFYLIRIEQLFSARIGHFAANTELYLSEKEEGIAVPKSKYIDLFFLDGKICNIYLLKMWKRILIIGPMFLLYRIYNLNYLLPGGNKHLIFNNLDDHDVYQVIDKTKPHLSFSKEEIKYGKKKLLEMGIPPNAKIALIIVRDSKYLEVNFKYSNFSYHSYRDCNINNYKKAAEYLVSMDFYVIRMGIHVKDKFESNNNKIIDYANIKKFQSPFMDMFIGFMCTFSITSGQGYDAIPNFLFRKPMLFTNSVPLGILPTYRKQSIIVPKKYYSTDLKEYIPFKKILNKGHGFFAETQQYSENKIEVIQNSAEEILEATKEMLDLINAKMIKKTEEELYEKLLWEEIKQTSINNLNENDKIYYNRLNTVEYKNNYLIALKENRSVGNISHSFIRLNKELFFGL